MGQGGQIEPYLSHKPHSSHPSQRPCLRRGAGPCRNRVGLRTSIAECGVGCAVDSLRIWYNTSVERIRKRKIWKSSRHGRSHGRDSSGIRPTAISARRFPFPSPNSAWIVHFMNAIRRMIGAADAGPGCRLLAYPYPGKRQDIGNPFGYYAALSAYYEGNKI